MKENKNDEESILKKIKEKLKINDKQIDIKEE